MTTESGRTLLLAFLFTFMAYAPLLPYVPLERSRSPASPAILMMAGHDANEVRLALTSDGRFASNPFPPPYSIGIWPKHTENKYVFGSGLWIGLVADVDGDGTMDTVGIQMYDPWDTESECAPGRFSDDPEDSLARLFVSTNDDDLADWPEEFRDDGGDPIVLSPQDIVGIYNDVNGQPHFTYGPAGVQVEQRSTAFLSDGTARAIIVIWDITNVSDALATGPFTFEDIYVGVDSDMDIGPEFGDDRTSVFPWQETAGGDSIPIRMGFVWDHDFYETDFEGIPGFVGVKFLLAPGNDTDGIDNDGDGQIDESPTNGIDDDGDGETDEWDEVDELLTLNFTWHSPPISQRPDPQSDLDMYRMMSCSELWECLEIDQETEVRFMVSTGPFDLEPGETTRFAAAYVFASPVGNPASIEVSGDPPRPDPNDPVFDELITTAHFIQNFFDAGFPDGQEYLHIYGTDRPRLTNVPGDTAALTTFIESSRGLARAELFTSSDGGGSFTVTDLEHEEGVRYGGIIPGPLSWWASTDYFAQAVDSGYVVARDPVDAPGTTYEYRLIPAPEYLPPDSVEGICSSNCRVLEWIDYDSDGDLDVLVEQVDVTRLYRNDGGRSFTNVTFETGISLDDPYEATAGDFDNDGFDDLLLSRWGDDTLHLFRNNGGVEFQERTIEVNTAGTLIMRPAWTDVNRDGYLDILTTADVYPGRSLYLHMNDEEGGFTEEAVERGLDFVDSVFHEALLFDADGDSDEDLLLPGSGFFAFFTNDDGFFVDRTAESGIGMIPHNGAVLDADGDTDLDLLLYSRSYQLELYENDGAGHFTKNTDAYGQDYAGEPYRPKVDDLNADGFPDILTDGSRRFLFLMNPERLFVNASDLYDGLRMDGHPAARATADVDVDGMLDLFQEGMRLSAGFSGGIRNNWLSADLEGRLSNRSGIGSVATLFAGPLAVTKPVQGKGALTHRLFFGTGEEEPDSLVVRWPSGVVQVERAVPANVSITVVEDSTFVGTGGREPSGKLPKSFALSQNYPNPFNPSTTIAFDIPESAGNTRAVLVIYDIRGRLVRRLLDRELAPGAHRVGWDGRDEAGVPAGSGVYLCRFEAGRFSSTRKLVLLR